ncbi:unnamed protein product, partial [Polarella glacialis]
VQLRLLVIDDFFISAAGDWKAGGELLDSVRTSELYLEQRTLAGRGCGTPGDVRAKVVHTYDEWTTDCGIFLEVGTGLTNDLFLEALEFVRAADCQRPVAVNAQKELVLQLDELPTFPRYSFKPVFLLQGLSQYKVDKPCRMIAVKL